MRIAPAMYLAGLLVAGCGAASAPVASRPSVASSAVSPAEINIPLTASDAWRHMQQTLQSPVDVYAAAWSRALQGIGAPNPSVGVAALAQGDDVSAFCADAGSFGVTGTTIVYCGTVHAGPDALPQAALILVPYAPYISALPNLSTSAGQVLARQGTALLLARVYALHVAGLLEYDGVRRVRVDCVAGLTIRSFIPTMSGEEWSRAVAFAGGFTVVGLPPPDMRQLKAGYQSDNLTVCV